MPVNTRELIDAVSIIAENQNIRVTVTSSFKASCIVAGSTFAGSVVSNWELWSSVSFCDDIFVFTGSRSFRNSNRSYSWWIVCL